MNRRAQSAIDYISTYGWALLTLSAVLGALYLFVDFKPTDQIADTCSFGIGESFYCVDAKISDTGLINISLKNTIGAKINVTQVVCVHKEIRVSETNNLMDVMPSSLFNVYCNMGSTGINFKKKSKVDVTVVYYKEGSIYPLSADGSVTSQPVK